MTEMTEAEREHLKALIAEAREAERVTLLNIMEGRDDDEAFVRSPDGTWQVVT